MTKTKRNDDGSMLVALLFVIVALAITGVIFSVTLAGNLNARDAINKQQQRALLRSVIESVNGEINSGSTSVTLFNAGQPDTTEKCKTSTTTFSVDFGLKNAKWKWCITAERYPNERYLEGMKAVITITTPNKIRYYRAHLRGAPENINLLAGSNLGSGSAEGRYGDKTGARGGFTSGNYMEIGTGTSPGIYTYTKDTVTSLINSAPVQAHNLILGQTLPNDEVWLARKRFDVAGGSCAGAGCLPGSVVTKFRQLPVSFVGGYVSRLDDPGTETLTPKCTEGKTWRASVDGPALSAPANGACYANMIFDVNTTVSGTDNTFYVWPGGTLQVYPGVSVNINATYPETRNLRIIASGAASNTAAVGMNVTMGAGAQFAGQVAAARCEVEGITYYGSLHCTHRFDGNSSKFYYQRELEKAALRPGFGSSMPTQDWWAYDNEPRNYNEVTLAGTV